jgi:protein O-mannosyl-transferase
MATPRSLSMTGLIDEFVEIDRNMRDRSFAFLLGAGASHSSRVSLGGEMVREWLFSLYRARPDYVRPDERNPQAADAIDRDRALDWACDGERGIAGFDRERPGASYPDVYWKMFGNDPGRGYAYLESKLKDAQLSLGYAFLAQIIQRTRHKLVVTTNFDNLVVEALSLVSGEHPLVCSHESLAGFVHANVTCPVVVKVHHDLRLSPKSSPEELKQLAGGFCKVLSDVLSRRPLIVLGYAGGDVGLMSFLASLKERHIPGGVYWCHRQADGAPAPSIGEFVARQGGALVGIPGFDELMAELGDRLQLDSPARLVQERAKEIANRFGKQSVEWGRAPAGVESRTDAARPELDPDRRRASHSMASILSRDTDSSWWQWVLRSRSEPDLDRRQKILEEGIASLPRSAPLRSNYAYFLEAQRRDYDAAEREYRKSIEIDGTQPLVLASFAYFLATCRNEDSQAERLYERAIELAPRDPKLLCAYGEHLESRKRDLDRAESFYKLALDAEPANAYALRIYARFLWRRRDDPTAAELLYKRAAESTPADVKSLLEYGWFLERARRDGAAAEAVFERALAAEPTNAHVHGSYAIHKAELGKWDEAQARFERAIEGAPSHAGHHANFAWMLFGRDDRAKGDLERGRIQLQQALDLLGPNATTTLAAECAMYDYCAGRSPGNAGSLGRLKLLIVSKGVRTSDWDYSGVVALANRIGHSEAAWLPKLADVLTGKAGVEALSTWPAWREA